MLNDGAFENQTKESFENVVKPKAIATILLDEISRKICPHLQHFVVFSSITCGYGNAGQTNYGFANSVMERICEMRQSENFPAVAIEWAGVADVGYLNTADIQYVPGTIISNHANKETFFNYIFELYLQVVLNYSQFGHV